MSDVPNSYLQFVLVVAGRVGSRDWCEVYQCESTTKIEKYIDDMKCRHWMHFMFRNKDFMFRCTKCNILTTTTNAENEKTTGTQKTWTLSENGLMRSSQHISKVQTYVRAHRLYWWEERRC